MGLRRVYVCASATLACAAVLCLSSAAGAQTVVRRARIGNNIEDITYVSSGPLADSLVIANGYDIFVAPLHPAGGPASPAPQFKLFDVRQTSIHNGPRGIAFLPNERLIAFHGADEATLQLIDENGTYRGTRTLTFPGPVPTYVEGMDWVPQSSPFYPNRLIVAANSFADSPTAVNPRIEVAAADGTVEAEIPVQPYPAGCMTAAVSDTPTCTFDPTSAVLGLAYQSPGRMLVSLSDGTDNIWAIDFNGNVIGTGPVYSDEGTHAFEGLVQLRNGHVVASNYFTGAMLFFDRSMQRLPSEDRVYSVGIGVSAPFGLAWDSINTRHVTLSRSGLPFTTLAAVSPDLTSVLNSGNLSPVPNLSSRITFVPDSNAVAAGSRDPNTGHRFVDYFDQTGALVGSTDVSNAVQGNPRGIEYIPAGGPDRPRNQFVISAVHGSPTGPVPSLVILSTDGSQFHAIPLPTDIGTPFQLAFNSNDNHLVMSDDLNVVVTDLNGNYVSGPFDLRTSLNSLSARDLSFISSGPDAGCLAVVDTDNSELIVFRLPGE